MPPTSKSGFVVCSREKWVGGGYGVNGREWL